MTFTVCLTHDVDRVYKTYQYLTHDLRDLAFTRLRTLLSGEQPYWTFDKIMRMEDDAGVRSTFFFLEESIRADWRPSSWPLAFGRYRFSDRRVARLIRSLDAHGWEVGLHGSYRSYKDLELLKAEKAGLERELGRPVVGVRQHHLNLEVPLTWELQRNAGLLYDASFGKRGGGVGYRDGRKSCFVDPSSGMFVIPLTIMDTYLFQMTGHDVNEAWRITRALVDEAEQDDAILTVLWHSQKYYDEEFPGFTEVYRRLLRECRSRGARFRTCCQVYEEFLEHGR